MRAFAIASMVGLLSSCSSLPNPQGCVDEACAPASCANGIRDDLESDVDCGGPTCRKCAGARDCVAASDCFSGTCIASTSRCAGLTTVSFADGVLYDSMYKPYVMMSGDLDGDGDIDLAVANEESSAVAVFDNDSAGGFAPLPATTPYGFPTGEYPTGGAIADFDRDGVADVITADYHGNSVSILLGPGAAATYTLTQRTSYATIPGAETSNLAVGDLNGDAILDVIATNPQAHSMSVFVGRTAGTLAAALDVPLSIAGTDPSEPYSVGIGDFDHDGIEDAAVADNRSMTVYIELGNGNGTFHSGPAQPPIHGAASFILITRDMNLDGNVDLVVANRGSDDVSVLLGRGDGGFRDAIVSSTGPGTGPYSVAVADFNLDGVPDVITANYLSGSASVLLGVGDGTFEAPIDTGVTGAYSYGVAVGDFNGDGKPDFATANAVSNNVAVKLSTAH